MLQMNGLVHESIIFTWGVDDRVGGLEELSESAYEFSSFAQIQAYLHNQREATVILREDALGSGCGLSVGAIRLRKYPLRFKRKLASTSKLKSL
jgi:hypothetical protein